MTRKDEVGVLFIALRWLAIIGFFVSVAARSYSEFASYNILIVCSAILTWTVIREGDIDLRHANAIKGQLRQRLVELGDYEGSIRSLYEHSLWLGMDRDPDTEALLDSYKQRRESIENAIVGFAQGLVDAAKTSKEEN